jgi:hypothetical protein
MRTFAALFILIVSTGCAGIPHHPLAGYAPIGQVSFGKVCDETGWRCYPVYNPAQIPPARVYPVYRVPCYLCRPYVPPLEFYWHSH